MGKWGVYQDGVVVYHSVELLKVDLERHGVDGDVVHFEAEVVAGFVEGGVCGDGNNTASPRISISLLLAPPQG